MSQRRIILVVPGLMRQGGEDLFRNPPSALSYLVRNGVVSRVSNASAMGVPEAALLGIDPDKFAIAQGPLTLAALRVNPPERSVHFHLSLASANDSGVIGDPEPTSTEEGQAVRDLIGALNGARLTTVWGESLDHGLVWEDGSIDLGTTPLNMAVGQLIAAAQPEGDGETILRRFIDDSVNLLTETEFNKRRVDEGKRPLNLLWPWGAGFRPHMPNLLMRRGELVHYESRSMRLDGLVRLAGYTHGSRAEFGRRLMTDWKRLAQVIGDREIVVILAENVGYATQEQRWDEADAMLRELADLFLSRVAELKQGRFMLVAPGGIGQEGLSLRYDAEHKTDNEMPFDTRILEDRRVPLLPMWETVVHGLRP